MTPLIVLLLLAAAPVLLALLFRVSALALFVAIAAGELLVIYLTEDVVLALNAFIKDDSVRVVAQLTMLLLPVLITLRVTRKSLPKSRVALNTLPLISDGLMLAALALPLLPSDLQTGIFSLSVGSIARRSQNIFIGVACLLHLFLLWHLNSHKHENAGDHRK